MPQAEALAAAMTETLATKQDLHELETRVDSRFHDLDGRLRDLETRMDARFRETELRMEAGFASLRHEIKELDSRWEVRFADLERRMTLRLGGLMMAGIAIISALDRLG
jgi:predicted nuclease with TOPRIM domain